MFLGAYLVIFFGWQGWTWLHKQRDEYQALVEDVRYLQREIAPYHDKADHVAKLMAESKIDPAKLSHSTVVAGASAALQKAAAANGIQLGPIRESPVRASAKEMASVQFEGTGQVRSVLALLHALNGVGYPLLIDSVQVSVDASRPGQVKVSMTVVILDFDQWKTPEVPRA